MLRLQQLQASSLKTSALVGSSSHLRPLRILPRTSSSTLPTPRDARSMHLRLPPVSFVASARPHAPPPFHHLHHHSTATAPAPIPPSESHATPERPKPSPPPAHQLQAAREATELPPALAEAKRRVHERLQNLKEEQESRRRGSAAYWEAGAGVRPVQLPKERSEDRLIQDAEGAARANLHAQATSTKDDPIQAGKVASTSTSGRSDATEPSLPTTEPALLALLRRLSRQHPPPHPEWIAYFHSLPAFETIVSPRTYAHLLHLGHSRSDCPKLYNELLEEMQERKLWSEQGVWAAQGRPGGDGEWAAREMLAAALKRGSRYEVEQVLELMRGRGWGGITVINDVRNLGPKGEHHGDERHKWKGKGKVEAQRNASPELSFPSSSPPPAQPPWTPPRTPKMVRYSRASLYERSSTFHELDHLLRRQPPHMPRDASRLTSEDVTALVESFVIEEKAPEAFRIAQSWLKAARQRLASVKPQAYASPSARLLASLVSRRSSSPSSTSNPLPSLAFNPQTASPPSPESLVADDKFARIAYHKTAIVLLNILLKSLFSERASLGVVKSFVKDFVKGNGLPSPTDPSSPSSSTNAPFDGSSSTLIPLIPGLTTLRTLLSGLEGRDGGFAKGISIVKWFSLQWGLPRTEWELLSLGEKEEGSPRLYLDAKKGLDPSGLPPHFFLDGTSALLLLRLAMADHRRWDTQLPPDRKAAFVEAIRTWWTALEKEEGDAEDVWCTRNAKVLECKAVESGLLDPRTEDRTGLLRAVMASRARERRVAERKREAWLASEKERQKRGIGRGEQKVAAWVVDS